MFPQLVGPLLTCNTLYTIAFLLAAGLLTGLAGADAAELDVPAPLFPPVVDGAEGGLGMGGRLPDALRLELSDGTLVERRREDAD